MIFLLGAGASVDAGMPTISGLTMELRQELPNLRDVNGRRRAGFARLVSAIERVDEDVRSNYERLFHWIAFLAKAQSNPFSKFAHIALGKHALAAVGHFPSVIGASISRLLTNRRTKPSYLASLGEFIPEGGRLDVFTLNYDCCVEDACWRRRINVTTGFDRRTKLWKPSLFRSSGRGINLYKLHGSLRWFPETYGTTLREFESSDRKGLPKGMVVSARPELVLGPASKIQADDPFITLFYEFHRAVQRARVCVVIGYGHADEHINTVLRRAFDSGLRIVDLNTGPANSSFLHSAGYVHLKQSAKDALSGSAIRSAVQRVLA